MIPLSPNRSPTLAQVIRAPSSRIAFGVATRGEVELIRLLRHLRDPRQIERTGDLDLDLDLEASQVLVKVREGTAARCTRGIVLVLLRLLAVFVRKSIEPKVVAVDLLKEDAQSMGSFRKLGHDHVRQKRFDEFSLSRVVVDEHHAVEPDVQFVGQLLDVARLVVPIDPVRGDVFHRQDHVGMFLEGFKNVLFIVLAADRENHALARRFEQVRLEIAEDVARVVVPQRDPLDAFLAKHATPERVVEIKHEAFFANRFDRTATPLEPVGELAREGGVDGHLRHVEVLPVDDFRTRDTPQKVSKIEDPHRRTRVGDVV